MENKDKDKIIVKDLEYYKKNAEEDYDKVPISVLRYITELHLAQSQSESNLPDIYRGDLNTKRIKAYKKLGEQYNLNDGTVRDVFCAGADWYKKLLSS